MLAVLAKARSQDRFSTAPKLPSEHPWDVPDFGFKYMSPTRLIRPERSTPQFVPLGISTQQETTMAELDRGQIVETAQQARGAERGPTVRNVLVWSLGLVILAFAIVYFVFFRT
jgi:hypothetical protein